MEKISSNSNTVKKDLEIEEHSSKHIKSSYELITPIGRGANSIVYKAKAFNSSTNISSFDELGSQQQKEEIIALKIIQTKSKNDESWYEGIRNEAQALLCIDHINVVKLYDFCTTAEKPFISLELADKGDLRAFLDSRKEPLNFRAVFEITLQVLDGLSAVHESGIIHRDIKPSNILLSSEGVVKLADFSSCLRQYQNASIDSLTNAHGTLDYISPECIEGKGISPAADLYSTAVFCFELITKALPLDDTSVFTKIDSKMKGLTKNASEYVPNIPQDVDNFFKKALHKDYSQRYKNTWSMKQDIQRILYTTRSK